MKKRKKPIFTTIKPKKDEISKVVDCVFLDVNIDDCICNFKNIGDGTMIVHMEYCVVLSLKEYLKLKLKKEK